MEHTRKTRLHNMVDERSAKDILNIYRFAKRNMDIGSFIELRSLFTRMVEAQTELDYTGSPKWVTPHEYFSSVLGIFSEGRELSLTNCKKAIKSLQNILHHKGCFGYIKTRDYGKTL